VSGGQNSERSGKSRFILTKMATDETKIKMNKENANDISHFFAKSC
jgi:hypothetical protein